MTDLSLEPDGQSSPGTTIRVEVAWAEAADGSEDGEPSRVGARVKIRKLALPAGATLEDALVRLDDPALAAALASGELVPAIYGERVQVSQALNEGDRIELLGPLIADPKHSRGRRAEVQRARRGDARWGRR